MARDVIVLDTHALLWWALDPQALSDTARDLCDQMERQGGYASAISLWELGTKVRSGKLDMGISISEFARRVQRTGVVEFVPVDVTTWLRSLALEWDHRDPADRVIVATALLKGHALLTKDQVVRAFSGVETIW